MGGLVVTSRYVPARGDIVWLQFNPQASHEEAGRRPAVVISPKEYNRKVGLALFCQVTSQVKGYPFGVLLPSGLAASGAVFPIKSRAWIGECERPNGCAPHPKEWWKKYWERSWL